MTRHQTTDPDADDTISLAVEIDPSEFDEPRQLMWEKLIAEYGQGPVAELIAANLDEDLTLQTMQLVNALWDNRHQLEVDGNSRAPPDG